MVFYISLIRTKTGDVIVIVEENGTLALMKWL